MLEVDPVSLSARIQAGATGPGLEEQLGEHGLTLRHFPQSFQFSTLGGWIATRAGGHFATLYTHIDDLVESVRALTPAGVWESRRLPGSGAGVSPDRMLIGSEGTLGVITEAWVRVRPRPTRRASARGAVRRLRRRGARRSGRCRSPGLYPSNCRLIDAREAEVTGAGDGSHALLVLGFESADARRRALDDDGARDLRRPRRYVGAARTPARGAARTVGSWREAFLRAPYLRDVFVAIGVLSETFETAITWDRFPAFHERGDRRRSRARSRERVRRPGRSRAASRTCIRTGRRPYYTILAPARRGAELEQWARAQARRRPRR